MNMMMLMMMTMMITRNDFHKYYTIPFDIRLTTKPKLHQY